MSLLSPLDNPESSGYDRAMNIGKKIKEARRARDLSQAALAELIGCHEDSILHWEKGEVNNPLPIYVEKLEKVLGISLKEERNDSPNKSPSP